MGEDKKQESILRRQTNWKDLWFYKKTVVLYQLTSVFTSRFLPAHGDRTVDQMVQAARSGKQNIVEGLADGVASMESEMKLLNYARGSIQELREDYEDYITRCGLSLWSDEHPRYNGMLEFCRSHNELVDYNPFFEKWNDEELANVAITLAHMVDKMITTFQEKTEKEFVADGGIRERMTRARIDYRNKNKKE